MKHLQEILDLYVMDQNNASLNFQLALHYLRLNQRVAANSYFLKAAELSQDRGIKFQSLLRIAYNYLSQEDRLEDAELMANYAKAINLYDPRPYIVNCITACYEERWIDLYNHANMAIQLKNDGLFDNVQYDEYYLDKECFYIYLGYAQNKLGMDKDAETAWNTAYSKVTNLGCKHQVTTLLDQYHYKNDALRFSESKYDALKVKFEGSDSMAGNYSQCMQDIFVLSTAKNSTYGTYLEIGSADPIVDSNTKLLEEYGWSGVSIDYDEGYVKSFKENRLNPVIHANALTCDYKALIESNYDNLEFIDYLQVDIDPASNSLEVLKSVISTNQKFGIITFEHDLYADPIQNANVKNQAIEFLKSHGYELIVNNVSMCESRAFEDWFVHKDYPRNGCLKNLSEATLVPDLFYNV